jgi:superfamily II DNA/RNA helicase
VVHERLAADAVAPAAVEGATFADLGLGQNIVKTIAELGAQHPFPIQAATIPAILDGRDVLARGRTGSGKTIAFGAPLVESVLRSQAGQKREMGRPPRALILAPTRELALQIDATVQPLARSVGLFTTQIYGGVPKARQLGALKKGIDIVIGTPGRIEDLVESRALDLSQVRVAVLDEADHMCDLGFLEPVQRIMRRMPRDAQRLLFSATLDGQVETLVREFLAEPAVFEVAGETQRSGTIDHRVLVVDHRDKREILRSLLDRDGKTLVFTRTRAFAEMLAEQFADDGIRALALHGDLDQARRTRNLEKLTSGRIDVLVATDVAARGIHVDDIDLVVQADAPDEYKTYLHRSGRTGRAGRSGTVVTLVTRARRERLADLRERADIEAPFDEVRPGDEVREQLAGRGRRGAFATAGIPADTPADGVSTRRVVADPRRCVRDRARHAGEQPMGERGRMPRVAASGSSDEWAIGARMVPRYLLGRLPNSERMPPPSQPKELVCRNIPSRRSPPPSSPSPERSPSGCSRLRPPSPPPTTRRPPPRSTPTATWATTASGGPRAKRRPPSSGSSSTAPPARTSPI